MPLYSEYLLINEQLSTWIEAPEVYVSCILLEGYLGTDPQQQVVKLGPGEPEVAPEEGAAPGGGGGGT